MHRHMQVVSLISHRINTIVIVIRAVYGIAISIATGNHVSSAKLSKQTSTIPKPADSIMLTTGGGNLSTLEILVTVTVTMQRGPGTRF